MITVGSVSRDAAARTFEFLAPNFRGRRHAMRAFTHDAPEFVFWIAPDGELWDARDAHLKNPPTGYQWILNDEPDYGGFLRGRVARRFEQQLIVIYCRPELLAASQTAIAQLLDGLSQMPIPIDESALVVSDNADIYGTVGDLRALNSLGSLSDPALENSTSTQRRCFVTDQRTRHQPRPKSC